MKIQTHVTRILCAGLLFGLSSAIPSGGAFADDPAPAAPAAPDAPAAPAKADAAGAKAGQRWMLGFTHGKLKRVLVDDGTGRETSYLYMVMNVVNKTGLPRPWRPFVTAKVDTRPTPYIAGGFATALARVRSQESDPELKPIEETGWKPGDAGTIADGASLKLVAIFGAVDPGWASFRIEVHGLVNAVTTLKVRKYGTAQIVDESAYEDRNAKAWAELKAAAKASGSDLPRPTAEYQEVREDRAWVINYKRQGDEFRPDDDMIEFVGEGWQIIGEPKLLRVIPASS